MSWRVRQLLLVAALAAAIGPAKAGPIVLHDSFDREVVLEAPARRIVTIFASNTELVASLGLADRIVGIEAYTRFPPQVLDRPLVGGRLGFSVDAVVARAPDLVVVTPARQAAHQLVDPMQRLGIPILVLTHRSIAEVMDNIRLIARATGVDGEGAAVTDRLEARLAAVDACLAGRARPRVVMITGTLGNGLMLVTRSDTYTGDAIEKAGGRHAFAGMTLLAQISPEAIIAADPDVLLFAGRPADLAELVARPGWRDMRAVRTQRAFTVPRAEFLIPGPRTVDGIERLAALLHPAAAGR
ncbi:ABC transporter substrate-binding protein [Xanthobacteraceae bacterium Astr-EGSB]|uniref:ABC transporter substrate-binding protein n=1 Tax=Astrobacterium formosum TaxID=3069710 RepID=UPI0027B7F7A2|nr:ABC transporter substrate-binding protein [Xanthobacteraceae bacterium Astr-EGSB]